MPCRPRTVKGPQLMLCQLNAVASQPLGTLFIRHVLGASSKNSVHCVFFFVFLLCVGLPRSTTRWDTRGSLERSSDFKSEARRYRTTQERSASLSSRNQPSIRTTGTSPRSYHRRKQPSKRARDVCGVLEFYDDNQAGDRRMPHLFISRENEKTVQLVFR